MSELPFEQLPFYRRLHWVNTSFLIGTPIAALVLAPLYLYFNGFGWPVALTLVLYCSVTCMSITAGYHRLLSHRSYEAKPQLKLLYLLFGAGSFQGSALRWCTDHRRHHAFVDTEKDPYDINQGFFYAHMGWLFWRDDPKKPIVYAPDLVNDKLVMWQHKYYVPLAIGVGFGLPTLVGWLVGSPLGGLVFGGFVRVVLTMHSTFLINSLAHTLGSRTYNERYTARDSVLMAVLAFGEGYHNYHHQFAADYRNGIRWYHWDPTKWAIRSLSLIGWASRLKRVSPGEILKARLRTEEIVFLKRGLPAERVQALKLKVEEAQARWRTLCDDYQRVKKTMQDQSREKIIRLKAELKVARLEFKMACAQWGTYRRTARALAGVA